MFHLVSEFGNAHKIVPTERKRDELIAQGWRVAEDDTSSASLRSAPYPQGEGLKAEKPRAVRKKEEKGGEGEKTRESGAKAAVSGGGNETLDKKKEGAAS